MIKKAVIIGIILLMIIGCSKSQEGTEVTIDNPFIGGTDGITINFENMREDVRDQGIDPFDIIIKLENLGERDVESNLATVKLSGINPTEFGTTQGTLTKNSPEDILAKEKTQTGEITPGPPTYIEFTGLNYKQKITGTQITFPIKADICYNYVTEAVGKLCIRKNIIQPEENGICEVIGDKTLYSSSAPVQITNLKENARTKNKIGFTFEVMNAGTGRVYETGKKCERTDRQDENKVYVKVKTNLAGLNCVGLESSETGSTAGTITLYGGSKVISCTQETPENDFEQVISISTTYDYETSITDTIIVKSSE